MIMFGLLLKICDCVCSADDLLRIVMEYCSGGDLLQRIRQQKTTQFCVDNVGLNLNVVYFDNHVRVFLF